jgi:hypothetical protein
LKKRKNKKILIALLLLFSFYIIWLGIRIIRFKTYRLPEEARSPLEIRGTYHIHTIFSDGKKTPESIAEIAARHSLDFIILTDHGDPNKQSMMAAGWKKNVLVLAGSELSVNRGHLVALGFDAPASPFSSEAELADYQIKAQGGFSIIAHPYSKISWSWGNNNDYDGLEIVDFNTMMGDNIFRIGPIFPALMIEPGYVLLKLLRRPSKSLKRWDLLNLIHPTYGFYSADAHTFYRSLLPCLQLHVVLENPLSKTYTEAAHQVYSALRRGRFYNAVDAAAQADGFDFWAQKGSKRISMGEESILDSPVTLHIRSVFPYAQEVHLLRNGERLIASPEDKLDLDTISPGFYRVEVYLKEKTPLREDIPWILSNPIYFREKSR